MSVPRNQAVDIVSKSLSRVFNWFSSKESRPSAILLVRNLQNGRVVNITSSKCAYTSDGTQCFSMDKLFHELPKSRQELCDSLIVQVEFPNRRSQFSVRLLPENVYIHSDQGGGWPTEEGEIDGDTKEEVEVEDVCLDCAVCRDRKGVLESMSGTLSKGDMLWILAGMVIKVAEGGTPRAEFRLLASRFSAAAKVQLSMEISVQKQEAKKAKDESKNQSRRGRRMREKHLLMQVKVKEEAEKLARQVMWNEAVKRICVIANEALSAKRVVHAGTVLKMVPNREEFDSFYTNPEFRSLEFRQVDGVFQLAVPSEKNAEQKVEQKAEKEVKEKAEQKEDQKAAKTALETVQAELKVTQDELRLARESGQESNKLRLETDATLKRLQFEVSEARAAVFQHATEKSELQTELFNTKTALNQARLTYSKRNSCTLDPPAYYA